MPTTRTLGQRQTRRAIIRYTAYYDKVAFDAAIEGHSAEYANALAAEAQALCGLPHARLSNRVWDEKAMAFLIPYGEC